MFIAALFTVAKAWTQPECPATEGWTKKMWPVHAMECDSATKRNERMPFAATWMDLEIIIITKISSLLDEISQTEKDKYHMIPLICGL